MTLLGTASSDEEEMIPLEFSDVDKPASDNENSGDESETFGVFDDDSDSDSAPEMWSFTEMRENEQTTQKLAAKAIKGQKEKLKNKRKELCLQNLKQREEKRLKIESKRLPEELLERLEEDLTPQIKETQNEDQVTVPQDQYTPVADNCDGGKETMKIMGEIKFQCVNLQSHDKRKKELVPKPVHFKDKMLYEGRIKREKSNRDAILKRKKQLCKVGNK